MMATKQRYVLDHDFQGYSMETDGERFFAVSELETLEGNTLDELKRKIGKPIELNIPAIWMRDYWSKGEPELVTITAASAAGRLMFTDAQGRKHNTGNGNHNGELYPTGDWLKTWQRLRAEKNAAEKAFDNFAKPVPYKARALRAEQKEKK